jgi:hypothetical protein
VKDDRHSSSGGASRGSPTSLTLLDRVRRQDADGWERLYALYTPLIHWWCSRKGVQGSDVQDLVQDVFVTVLGRVEEFQHGGRRGSFRAGGGAASRPLRAAATRWRDWPESPTWCQRKKTRPSERWSCGRP